MSKSPVKLSEAESAQWAIHFKDQVDFDNIESPDDFFNAVEAYTEYVRRPARRKRTLKRAAVGTTAIAAVLLAGAVVKHARETTAEHRATANSLISSLNDALADKGFGSMGDPSRADISQFPFIVLSGSYMTDGMRNATVDLKLPSCALHNVQVSYETNDETVITIDGFIALDGHYKAYIFEDFADLQEQTDNKACDLQKLNVQ